MQIVWPHYNSGYVTPAQQMKKWILQCEEIYQAHTLGN